MNELIIEREFSADPQTVFAFVTQTENLLKWWGPEGTSISAHDLDLSRKGAWSSTLINSQGGRHKMSGEVLAVDPPHSVELTWGWHDDHDQRGHESRVRFEVSPASNGGTRFVLTHSGLANEESAANHTTGWTSSLKKLEKLAN